MKLLERYIFYNLLGSSQVCRFDLSGVGLGESRFAGECLQAGCTFRSRNEIPFFGRAYYSFRLPKHPCFLKISKQKVWCPFSKEEITEHLTEIKQVRPDLKWEIRSSDSDNFWFINLSLRMKHRDERQHLYVLTRFRYLYEIPFCFILRDVFDLREQKEEYRHFTIDELFIVLSLQFGALENETYTFGRSTWYDHAHSAVPRITSRTFSRLIYPENTKILKRLVKKLGREVHIHDLFQDNLNYKHKIIHFNGPISPRIKLSEDIFRLLHSLQFWFTDSGRLLRWTMYEHPGDYWKYLNVPEIIDSMSKEVPDCDFNCSPTFEDERDRLAWAREKRLNNKPSIIQTLINPPLEEL